MRLPGHNEDDNAFYARAVVNYPDHDPVRTRKPTRWAGPVRYVNADGEVAYQEPYTQDEVKEIDKQGRDRPRSLTHDETQLTYKNRREARADLAAMEEWYRTQLKETVKGRDLEHARGDLEDLTLLGIDEDLYGFWRPIVW